MACYSFQKGCAVDHGGAHRRGQPLSSGRPIMHFTANEIERFAAWSGDHNPAHVNREFAQAAGFREPIAHGVLGVIRALGSLSLRSPAPLRTLEVDFRGPVICEAGSEVTANLEGDRVSVALKQDGREVLVVCGQTGTDESRPAALPWFSRLAECLEGADTGKRLDAADRPWADLQSGIELVATYATDPPPDAATASGILTPVAVRILGLCSYLQGMELPGLRSSIRSLRLRLYRPEAESSVLWYRARTTALDPASRVLQTAIEIAAPDGEHLATAELHCYIRPAPAVTDIVALAEKLAPGRNPLAGKVALVCGGSRGLGGDLTSALALAGCRVYAGFRHTCKAANELAGRLAERGLTIELLQGDAGNPAWCESARSAIVERERRLDLLVLCACAPPQTVAFGPASARPLSEYIEKNLPAGLVPLSALLPLLTESRGGIVFLSSFAARSPEPGFAHYAALKRALETVVETAGREAESVYTLIARPPRLVTSWNDTPEAAGTALPAGQIAADIVNHLAARWQPGRIDILESFTESAPAAAAQSGDGIDAEIAAAPADEVPEQQICESLIALEAEVARMTEVLPPEAAATNPEFPQPEPQSLLDRVHSGAVPIRLKIGPEGQMTGWVIESGRLEAVRGALADSSCNVHRRNDLPFSLAVIAAGAGRDSLLQLGWGEVAPFETNELVIHPHLVLTGLSGPAAIAAGWGLRASTAVRAMLQQPTRFDIRRVNCFDIRHDHLWEAAARDITCGIIRDAAWLNEKYVDEAIHDIVRLEVLEEGTLRGIVVLTFREADDTCPYRRGYLVELIAPPSDGRLLKQLVQIAGTAAAECNADALLCLCISAPLSRALRHNGFRVREPRRHLLVNPGELPEALHRSALTAQDWFMTIDEQPVDSPDELVSEAAPASNVDAFATQVVPDARS